MLESLRSNTRFAVSSQAMTGVSSAILLRPWQLIKVSFTMLAGVWHCEVWISHVSCLLNMPRRCKTQLNKTRLDRAHHQARSEQRQAGCIAPCTSSADACSQWPAAKPGRDYRHSRWQRGSRDQAPDTFQNGTAVLPPLKGLRKPHCRTKGQCSVCFVPVSCGASGTKRSMSQALSLPAGAQPRPSAWTAQVVTVEFTLIGQHTSCTSAGMLCWHMPFA